MRYNNNIYKSYKYNLISKHNYYSIRSNTFDFILLSNIPMNSLINTIATNDEVLLNDNEEEMDLLLETIQPIPMVRQSNKPRFLRYINGVLVDQDNNPTTPEKHNTTHSKILQNICKYRRLCHIEDDAEFLALIEKYIPEEYYIVTTLSRDGVSQSNPERYRLIGLHATTTIGNSYETNSMHSDEILHDDSGKGIAKQQAFTSYILYVARTLEYYAIHLSYLHCASFGGKLCSIAKMRTTPCSYEDAMTNSTHIPANPFDITFTINDCLQDDAFVSVYNDPDTCVFEYSKDGNDERTPSGFVYVNMELFMPK
jgi:hypothetical protein